MNLAIVAFAVACLAAVMIYLNFEHIIRFNTLKSYNGKFYIQNYKNLNKCSRDKLVLSLTSTPDRIKHISPTLNSLLNQTTKVDQISLNLPETCNNKSYDTPKELNEMCNIYTVGRDYGIGTKYIPTLLREGECGTKIILLNDDYIYGKDLIEKLIKESDDNPNKCIYTGNDFKNSEAILIKPEFVNDINRSRCDNEWLENNLNVEKKNILYNKNNKYI